jgi:NADPH:quinone reductase-like Zn-dependent oxidoreductase
MPICGPDEVILRNQAVGLNPIDWKSVAFNFCMPEFPWINGRESAGIVHAVGSNVQGLQIGQKAWTSTYYRDRRAGCFQTFTAVPSHTVLPIPEGVEVEKAACLGVPALTAGMTLWKWLDVPFEEQPILSHDSMDEEDEEYLLIWGGATSTGQFAIQFAANAGQKTIVVASSRTGQLMKDLGATHVVERCNKTNEEIVAEVKALGQGRITKAIDLVGAPTAKHTLSALSPHPSPEKKSLFAPLAMMKGDEVVPGHVEVLTVEMKRFVLDSESKMYAEKLNELVGSGTLRLPEVHVLDGGLEVVEEGLERIRKGDLVGKKVVVRLD